MQDHLSLFQLPSKVSQRSKDSSSDVARSTGTSSYEGEKGGQHSARGATLVKQNHNPHNFWRPPKTALTWEQSVLFSGVSLFVLSSIMNV